MSEDAMGLSQQSDDRSSVEEIAPSSASEMQKYKIHKRNGSLRKTALLGSGQTVFDKSNSNTSPLKSNSPSKSKASSSNSDQQSFASRLSEPVSDNLLNHDPVLGARILLQQRHAVLSPFGVSLDTYIPTSDDSETVRRIPGSFQRSASSSSEPTSSEPSTRRVTQIKGPRNPLESATKSTLGVSQVLLSSIPSNEEWDYSSTERWGWVILCSTWIVFVVGMGSCLGVWSWAWDVGDTRYNYPELEDDPTLPIVGYYPALIILTAVMCWVWVIVAWVGMKYFKHAKIQGDDT